MDRAAEVISDETATPTATPDTLATRLRNWWNGAVLPDETPDDAAAADVAPPAVPDEHLSTELDESAWSLQRLRAAEAAFGGDCRSPLGAQEVLDMVRPVGLNETKAVLDLGAGLGSAARLLTSELGVWVTGLDPSRTLAAEGMIRSNKAGLGRKAPIQSYDAESVELPERAYDCVFAREIFYMVQDKNRLFGMIFNALKGNGELVFTDFCVGRPGIKSKVLKRFVEAEPVTPHLWTADQTVRTLRDHAFQVIRTEDETESYREIAMTRLADLEADDERKAAIRKAGDAVLDEVELWATRLEALGSCDVTVVRFHLRRSDLDDGVRMMSNW